jgi:hypothetical protein
VDRTPRQHRLVEIANRRVPEKRHRILRGRSRLSALLCRECRLQRDVLYVASALQKKPGALNGLRKDEDSAVREALFTIGCVVCLEFPCSGTEHSLSGE